MAPIRRSLDLSNKDTKTIMTPAKKLFTEPEDQQEHVQEQKILADLEGNRVLNVVKLLILMILTYVIIFM